MKEIIEIIKAYEKARERNQGCALATVVHVEGSSYRRPGARMLVTDEGRLTGAISGGCLEGDALQKAMFAIHKGQSMIITYDTMDDDDAKLGVGLGCNGIIQILFEPIFPERKNNPIELLKLTGQKKSPALLLTLYSLQNKRGPQIGTCLLYQDERLFTTLDENSNLHYRLIQDSAELIHRKKNSFRNYLEDRAETHAFFQFIPAPISLVVVGAGNDSVPLIQLADGLGWQTTVVDGRQSYADPQRFIPACQVFISKPEKIFEHILTDQQTAIVLMTHNYNYDIAALKEIIKTNCAYIGLLGPRKKWEKMASELKKLEPSFDEEQIKMVYGPCGLDIGAENPEEIALSVLSEIKSVLAGKNGGHLREKVEPIHPRLETTEENIIIKKQPARTVNH